MHKVSLKISISPRDFRFLQHLLPHQLRVWHSQVDEVLIVFDYHGYDSEPYIQLIAQINSFIEGLAVQYEKIRLITVDYSEKAKKEVSKVYFNNKDIPEKTHRYGPYYSYYYGLFHTKYDYVLNIDCDLFFGGHNPNWINEAIGLLKSDKQIITCSPWPGPPTADGRLIAQEGQMDDSPLRKEYFDSLSTRIFFVYKPSFIEKFCPIPIKIAEWPLLIRALVRKRPFYALPEDILTDIMREKRLKRVDFLGSKDGLWSLHPPFRNESFFENLPRLISQVENDNIPEAQKGHYDINDSMINWDDAREEIKNASLKRKLLNFIMGKSDA